jgi:hypothetical protein
VRRFRKKRYAFLALLVGIYGFAFVFIVFGEDRDGRFTGVRTADAHVENVTCARNWFVLGATWNCRATVVTPDGKRYPYSSFASALTPNDIGRNVEMSKTSEKGQGSYFTPTRPRPSAPVVYLLGMVVFGPLAMVGPFVLWPFKEKSAAPRSTKKEGLKRAQVLRERAWIFTFIGIAAPCIGFAAFHFLELQAAKWVISPLFPVVVVCVVVVPECRKRAREHERQARSPAPVEEQAPAP